MASYKKYQTKDGIRWSVQISIGKDPATGKYKSTTRRGFKRKQDAEDAAREILNELSSGTFITQTNITFEQVYNEWLGREEKRLKPSSIMAKKSKFNQHILPNFAKLYIKDITTSHCQSFIDKLSKKMASFKDYGIQLNLVFRYAIKNNYITCNPMDKIVYPIPEEEHRADNRVEKVQFWDRETVNKFLRYCKNELSYRQYAMFRLFLFTGLRKGELAALEEKDVLQETKQLNIYKNLFWRDNNYFLLKPKTANAIRVIKLDNETFDILLHLMELNKELRAEWNNPDDVEHFLFPRSDLKPMRLAHPNEALEAACRRSKVEYITVHGLRHTHASMLFASGARMKDVQMRLGHSRISTTMDIYTHVTKQSEENISNLLACYLNEETDSEGKSENGEVDLEL